MGLAGRVEVLREPNYRRLFLGRTISLVGDGIAPVAIAFAVLDLTGSATDLGIILAAHSLAIIALVLVGGVYADRISPRLSMLRADLVRTVTMGGDRGAADRRRRAGLGARRPLRHRGRRDRLLQPGVDRDHSSDRQRRPAAGGECPDKPLPIRR
ncbi:MAG TPA: hypothetical protein VHM66_09425 [Solirubrobacterales bacterium]|nr:hypothetical protein [Solirubrobacterales bacterium]